MHQAFEEIFCNLCGGKDVDILYPSNLPQDLSLELTKRFAPSDHAKGHDQLVRCRNCGLAYSNPRMKREYMWQGYSDAVDEKYATQAEERIATFTRTIHMIEKYIPQKGKILDIGCAAGFFLKVAKDAGWDAHGIEPNKGLAEFGRKRYGIDITSVDFLSSQLPDNSFDAVTFWDVLEHVSDPTAYIHEAYRILKPGGFIFVNFPDFGSVFVKIFGEKWWFLSPVHIYYFTRKTLAKLLEKNGFQTKAMRMHWQTLALGYLFVRFVDYSTLVSKLGTSITKALGLNKFPMRYYASQALAIAQKPLPNDKIR